MVFSSVLFIFLFLPVFLTIYFCLRKEWKNAFILFASLLFYFWGEGRYIIILLICIVANYYFALRIERSSLLDGSRERARRILKYGIIFNILLLFIYKYTNFAVDELNTLLKAVQIPAIPLSKLHLPIGISFFTFQAISYLMDVYRGDVKATKSLINFGAYKSLFPQLIAGPIIRYRDVAAEMADRRITPELFVSGMNRFITGLGKKVLIANTVAAQADLIFSLPPESLTPGVAWIGILCYTLQIYFDFSGYSDMAIGMGRMMGFHFLENFNYPYISRSIQEFWRRWHISLSSWFRDYLYIPLGGSRCSNARTNMNLLFVFLLCGFWHGASWNFIIWGLWHGGFLMLERLHGGALAKVLRGPVSHVYVLLVVMVGWVFFRAETLTYAIGYLKVLFGLQAGADVGEALSCPPDVWVAIVAGIIGSGPVLQALRDRFGGRLVVADGTASGVPSLNLPMAGAQGIALLAVFLLSVMSLATGTYNPFIYFRF